MADLELVRRLSGATHLAVLATTRPDATVHASFVNAGLIEDPVTGRQVVGLVAVGGARKLEHMRRSGRAAAVFTSGFEWVAVEGPVHIIGPDDPSDGFDPAGLPELLRRIFVAAGGQHDDWQRFDQVMAEERRSAVFVTPERISGNAA